MNTSNVNKNSEKTTKIITYIIIAILAIVVVSCTGGGSSGGSSNSRTCKSCGRTFTDSENFRSIARTGMCKNCYNNFKWGMAATGRGTAYHIDNDEECEIVFLSFRDEAKEEYLAY